MAVTRSGLRKTVYDDNFLTNKCPEKEAIFSNSHKDSMWTESGPTSDYSSSSTFTG